MADSKCDCPYVRGTVVDETDERVASAVVWLGVQVGGRYLRARRTKTDSQGHFSLPAEPPAGQANRRGTTVRGFRLEVEVSGRAVRVVGGTSGWKGAKPPEEVTLVVRLNEQDTPKDDPVAGAPGEGVSVRGRVRHVDGTPAEGAVVRAFHLTITGESELGDDDVSETGAYLIPYTAPAGTTRLVVRVYADEASTEELCSSDVRFAPDDHERLDLTICDDAFRAPTAWSTLDAAIPDLLGAMPPAEATARAAAIVTAELQESERRVARYLCARRLAPKLGVDPQVVFGLLYSGKNPTVPSLARMTTEEVREALDAAADANEINRALVDDAELVAADLEESLASLFADVDRPGGLGPLMQAAGLSSAQRSAAATLGIAHQGDPATFWTRLAEHSLFTEAIAEDFRSVVVLGSITFKHAPLVRALRTRLGTSNAEGVAAYTADDWADVLEDLVDGQPVGLPGHAQIVGDSTGERTESYVRHLLLTTERVFPSRVVVERLKVVHVGTPLGTLLTAAPDLDFARARIPYDLTQGGHSVSDTVKEQLRVYQRLFRIAPQASRYEAISALKEAGIGSALPVARMSVAVR